MVAVALVADVGAYHSLNTMFLRLEGHMRKTTFKESYRLPMMDAKHSAMNEAYITLGIGTGVE